MKRSNVLPAELGDWSRSLPKGELRHRLRHSIAQRAANAGLSLDTGSLAASVEALDERYFACQEDGKKREALSLFKQARLLSAQRFLVADEVEEALYEFFHSLDNATPEAAITALQKPNQSPEPMPLKRPGSP